MLLIRDDKLSEVSTAHLAAFEQSTGEATLVHLNELDEVVQGELLSLNGEFVLATQACDLQ